MTDFASLTAKLDFSQVDPAAAGLDKLTAAGGRAEVQTNKVTTSTQLLRDEQAKATSGAAQLAEAVLAQEAAYRAQAASANATVKAQVEFAAATQAATTAQKDFIVGGLASGAALDVYQAKMIAATIAQTGMTEAQARAALGFRAAAVAETEAAAASVAASAAVTAGHGKAAASSLQVRESLVILREAARGDLTRMAGSATILAGSFGLMSGAALAAAAPFIALAVVIGVVAFAMAKGSAEAANLSNALSVTNNYAGLTASSFDAMAKRVSEASDASIGSSKAAISQLVSSGKFSADTIELMVSTAERFSQFTGESADKIVKSYEDMRGGVVKWAVQHEEVYHDLTLAQIDYINGLEKQGKHEAAEAQLMQDIHDNIYAKAAPAYGYFQQALHGVANAASDMWDKLLGLGRTKTIDEQIANAQALVKSADTPYNNQAAGGRDNNTTLSSYQTRLAALQALKTMQDQQAAAMAKSAQANDDAIRAKYDNEAKKSHKEKIDRVQEEIDKLKDEASTNRDLAAAYDLSTAAGFRAAAMQKASAEATKLHTDISKFAALELEVAVTKALADGAKSLDQDRQKIATQTQVNTLMAATGISQQTANKQVADSTEIAKLEAAQASAKGDDLVKLTKLIDEKRAAQIALNAVALSAVAIAEHQAATNEIATLTAEIDLIGKSNRERTEQLAIIRAVQAATARGAAPGSVQSVQAAFDAKDVAGKQTDLVVGQDRYNTALGHTQFLLGEIDTTLKDTGRGLTDAFGHAGTAVADLTVAFVAHAKALDAINVARKQYVDLQKGDTDPVKMAEFDKQAADIRITAIGAELDAAASFFGKQTAAYKVLHAAEEVYRIFQFAMAAKSILFKSAETTATVASAGASVASDATTTASTLVSSALKATAHGVVAIARAIASLPFPFNIAAGAATAAALVGFGVKLVGGGSGSGALPGANDAAAAQAAQGTGTVLGDPTAQSKSIANALTIAEANQNADLQYSSQMVASLRSIDSNISTLTAAIAKDLGVGGSLAAPTTGTSTSGPSLLTRIFAPISNLLPGLFGSSTTSTLQDQGLKFTPQTIGSIISQGINGSSYAEVASETKKKFLGITYSDKTSLNTTTNPLDAGLNADLTRVIASLQSGVLSAASVLGVTGAKETLDALVLNLGTVSLKGLTGTALTDAINAVFSKAGDDMAAAILPAISTFQKAGEGAFETLTRLAHDYQTVDVTLQSIGKTFATVGVDSIAARENLVSLAGGLDALTAQTAAFSTAFLTPAQQLAPVQAAVTAEMTRLGLASITTKDQFAKLVLGIDVSTDAGAQLYAALLNVAPAFAKVADAAAQAATDATTAAATAVTNAQSDVSNATSALTSAYNTQSSAIQSTITKFQGFADALAAFDAQLAQGSAGGQSPQAAYLAARSAFQATASAAQGGDATALGNLQSVSQAYLTAAKAVAPDAQSYARDLAAVRNAVQGSEQAATAQVDTAQAQLDALNASVSQLIDLNANTVSVADAIKTLVAALAAQTAATLAQSQLAAQQAADAAAAAAAGTAAVQAVLSPPSPAVAIPAAATTPANDNPTPDVAAIIQAQIAQQFGAGGGGFRLDDMGNIMQFATGGSFTVGGSGAQDSQRFNMALSPGEAVNVSRPGDNAAMLAELRAMRAELAGFRRESQAGDIAVADNTGKMAKILKRVTPDGNSLLTSAA